MELAQLKFKSLKWAFSLATSALLAWAITDNTEENFMVVFLFLAVGLPLAVWIDRIKNIPAYFLSARLMNKKLILQTKEKLRNLPLTTAEEWNDFQSFYESDKAITEYTTSDPKAFAVAARYSIQTLRDCGNFLDFINSGTITSRAIEEIYEELTAQNKTTEKRNPSATHFDTHRNL